MAKLGLLFIPTTKNHILNQPHGIILRIQRIRNHCSKHLCSLKTMHNKTTTQLPFKLLVYVNFTVRVMSISIFKMIPSYQ